MGLKGFILKEKAVGPLVGNKTEKNHFALANPENNVGSMLHCSKSDMFMDS